VHEAFANLTESEHRAGDVYQKMPPDDIEELPPDQRPDGENISWIPGYWSYDDDRDDYIWVSGVWRDLPPGRQWIPGYWHSVQGGAQFVSGFWSDAGRTEVEYLPRPPAPLDVGPSSPMIGRDANWASGSWVWVENRYAWQPGYWVAPQPNWVWTPAHYVWTPRGYVFVSGYWDYDIARRGMMFAPVYYSAPVYQRPDYFYSPSVVIGISFAFGNLFVHSHSHHYYYGDYYDDRYRNHGYEPWYSGYDRRDRGDRYYREDPLYVSYRSQQLRRDKDWDKHNRSQYDYRRQHAEARPPQIYLAKTASGAIQRDSGGQEIVIARPIEQVVKSDPQPEQFKPVDADRRKQYQTQGRDMKQYRAERQQIEADSDSLERTKVTTPDSRSVTASKSPTSAQTRPQGRDVPRGSTPAGQEKQTAASPEPRKDKALSAPTKGTETPSRDVNQRPSSATRASSEAATVSDGAKDPEQFAPVKKKLRASPIASQHAKSAPAAPDIPQPASGANSDKTPPDSSGAHGAKPQHLENAKKGNAKNPK
jgi:hypothetical protein